MSNYCTNAHVGVLLGKTFDATKTPTSTEVDVIIDQITKEIDSVLYSIGVTSQPTDLNLLGMLQKYCSFGSAGVTGMTYFRNTNDIVGSNPEWYYGKYEKFLEDLVERPELFGIVTGAETIAVSSNVLDGTYTEDEIKDMMLTNEEYEF